MDAGDMHMPHLLSFRVSNLLWFQDTMFFIGALGGVFGLVLFGYFAKILWRVGIKQRHYPAFILSSGFWMLAIGSISFATEEVLERFSWIKYSVVSPITDPIFRLGSYVTVALLVIGFLIEALMLDKPNKNS